MGGRTGGAYLRPPPPVRLDLDVLDGPGPPAALPVQRCSIITASKVRQLDACSLGIYTGKKTPPPLRAGEP